MINVVFPLMHKMLHCHAAHTTGKLMEKKKYRNTHQNHLFHELKNCPYLHTRISIKWLKRNIFVFLNAATRPTRGEPSSAKESKHLKNVILALV